MKKLEERIALATTLIDKRKEIDDALTLLFTGSAPSKRGRRQQAEPPTQDESPTPPDEPAY